MGIEISAEALFCSVVKVGGNCEKVLGIPVINARMDAFEPVCVFLEKTLVLDD